MPKLKAVFPNGCKILSPELSNYGNTRLKDLMRGRRPVKISGFFKACPAMRNLRRGQLLHMLADSEITAARLADHSLDTSGKDTFRIKTFSGKEILRNGKIWQDYYFSEPTDSLPEKIRSGIVFPFSCSNFLWFKSRLWLAGPKSRTPLHRDIPHNLILVTQGKKDILLVSPRDSAAVYPHRLFSKLPNFARVNLRKPDFSAFPRLKGLQIYRVTLSAGDMVYIPPFWWHDVQNESPVTSLNFWFAPFGMLSALAALSYTAKKMLGVYKYEWRKPRKTEP